MKVNIEVEIPDGYEFVRYGKAVKGDTYSFDDRLRLWNCDFESFGNYVIVKEKKSDEQLVRELLDELCQGLKRLGYNDTGYRVYLTGGLNSANVQFGK